MYCQKCGRQLPGSASFCVACGARTGDVKEGGGNSANSQQPSCPQAGNNSRQFSFSKKGFSYGCGIGFWCGYGGARIFGYYEHNFGLFIVICITTAIIGGVILGVIDGGINWMSEKQDK